MRMSNTNNEKELNCYLEIIEFFQHQSQDPESIELWKDKSIMELMKVLKRTNNKLLIRNALILMITLFEHLPPDLFNNKGINTKILNKEDKESLKSILRTEFINEVPN